MVYYPVESDEEEEELEEEMEDEVRYGFHSVFSEIRVNFCDFPLIHHFSRFFPAPLASNATEWSTILFLLLLKMKKRISMTSKSKSKLR